MDITHVILTVLITLFNRHSRDIHCYDKPYLTGDLSRTASVANFIESNKLKSSSSDSLSNLTSATIPNDNSYNNHHNNNDFSDPTIASGDSNTQGASQNQPQNHKKHKSLNSLGNLKITSKNESCKDILEDNSNIDNKAYTGNNNDLDNPNDDAASTVTKTLSFLGKIVLLLCIHNVL